MMNSETLLAMTHPVLTVVIGLVFVVVWARFAAFASFAYFGLAYISYGLGMAVQTLLWPGDPVLNILLATLLYFGAVLLFYVGLIRYGEARPKWLLVVGLTLSALLLRGYFAAVESDRIVRIYVLNGFVAAVFSLALWQIRARFRRSVLDTLVFLLIGIFVFAGLLRSLWAPTTHESSFGYDGTLYWLLTQVSLNVFLILFALLLILIAAARALEKMRLLGWHDGLTGLSNRTGFREKVSRQMRRRCAYSLILIDLDHFKQVNDRYGHSPA